MNIKQILKQPISRQPISANFINTKKVEPKPLIKPLAGPQQDQAIGQMDLILLNYYLNIFSNMKNKRGRKPLYNEKTIVVSFKCPESKQTEIKTIIKNKLKDYETNK